MQEKIKQAGMEVLEKAKRLLVNNGLAIPSDCWLSGQWFALSVLQEMGMWNKNVILNDIDVFNISKYDPQEKQLSVKKTNMFLLQEDSDHYNRIFYSANRKTKYKIVATSHIGILNLTNVKMNEKSNDEGFDLVSKFDINSTQCAINTSTFEVVYTDAFVEFAKNQILSITNVDTIGHSLVRLVKKSKELNCEFNTHKEFGKLIGESISQFNPYFGEVKYNEFKNFENLFRENGLEVEEIFLYDEDKKIVNKYPLYRFKRIFNDMSNSTTAKHYNSFDVCDIAQFSKFIWSKSKKEIQKLTEKYKQLKEIELDIAYQSQVSISSTILLERFFMEKDFSYKTFKEFLMLIKENNTYVYAVNSFFEYKELQKWITAFSGDYDVFLTKSFDDLLYRQKVISVDEILRNKDCWNLKKLIEDSPNLGESNLESSKIIGQINNLLVVELQQSNKKIKVFGYNIKTLLWEEEEFSDYEFTCLFEIEEEECFIIQHDSFEIPQKYESISKEVREKHIDLEVEIPF